MRAILTYHSIDTGGSVISISPAVFERQIRWIAASSVAVMPLPELLRQTDGRDAVAITFDDAYTNFQREAWPRLRDHGLPVTLFVPTGFVGRTNAWGELPGGSMPDLPILGWDDLGRIQEEGVTLGAHSRTHPDLRALDGAALEEEISGSVDDLLRLTGRRPATFAYPYGYWTPGVASVVRSACACACTTELRPLREEDDAHLLPRLDSYYLRGPARIENFGGFTFDEYLRVRMRLRTWARRIRSKSGT